MSENPEHEPNFDSGELAASPQALRVLFNRIVTDVPVLGYRNKDYEAQRNHYDQIDAEYAPFFSAENLLAAAAANQPAIVFALDVTDPVLLRQAGYGTDVRGVRFLVDDYSRSLESLLTLCAGVVINHDDNKIDHRIAFDQLRPGVFEPSSPQQIIKRHYRNGQPQPGILPVPPITDLIGLTNYATSLKMSGTEDVRVDEVDQINNLLDLLKSQKGL